MSRATTPRAFNDSWRAQWSSAFATVLVVPALALFHWDRRPQDFGGVTEWVLESLDLLLLAVSLLWIVFGVIYAAWTHIIFGRLTPRRLAELAGSQGRVSLSDQLSGFGGPVSWSISAAFVAVGVAILVMVNAHYWPPLVAPLLAIGVAATSWLNMAYAYALRYARLGSAGGQFRFDLAEEPGFSEYLSLSLITSTLHGGGATAVSREALRSLRGHAVTAFAFNAVVVALTVSLAVTSVGI